MASSNITEVSNFDAAVYLIDINDPATGGLTGNANKQAIALANRTRWLYNNLTPLLGKIFLNVNAGGSLSLSSGSSAYARDGVSHQVPLVVSPDYTTPNDGITRTYRVKLQCFLNFTYNSSGHFHADLIDYSNNILGGPVIVAGLNCRENYIVYHWEKIISIGPNKPLIWLFSNVGTGASMSISDIQFTFEQL